MEKTKTQNKIERKLTGTVVSDKMNKTRVVEVVRLKKHPRYQKYAKVSTRYKAHDEENTFVAGDVVEIRQTRPLSRDKRWEITKLVSKSVQKDAAVEEGADAI
jgi:small subunit ribosomal protein S17